MAEQTGVTVKAVCQRYSVKPEKVLAWIHSGQLRALNLATDPNSPRPRWRILVADLEAFEQSRSTHHQGSANAKPTRRHTTVKEFV